MYGVSSFLIECEKYQQGKKKLQILTYNITNDIIIM